MGNGMGAAENGNGTLMSSMGPGGGYPTGTSVPTSNGHNQSFNGASISGQGMHAPSALSGRNKGTLPVLYRRGLGWLSDILRQYILNLPVFLAVPMFD